jgi:G3E family GTPase
MKRTRFLMIGGFLGAGKTTTLARLARHFIERGMRVALVTNDQAYGLVDTESLRAQGFEVGEVTGACFCCKFNDLVGTVRSLGQQHQPDIILAEPVGSCTDLAATVVEPLRQFYGDRFEVGRLGVLLKPEHGRKILGGEAEVGFSPKAAYIFLKQLEEADLIAVNKVDKLGPSNRADLLDAVRRQFPNKPVVPFSARTGEGFELFLEELLAERSVPVSMEVDYDIYAAGEAELGWLNCLVELSAASPRTFSLDELLVGLVERLRDALQREGAEPAHLKVLGEAPAATAIANLVSSGVEVELSVASGAHCQAARLVVNARVAIAPETLAEIVEREAAEHAAAGNLTCRIDQMQRFRPGRPVPTHRLAVG